MNRILEDVKNRLKIEFNESDIHVFTEGKTEAQVFSIKDEYLIKVCTEYELNVYNEFFSRYKSEYFQKMNYINYDLSYVCLSFLKGHKFDDDLEINYFIKSVYEITSNYKEIDYEGFGYIFDDHKSWYEFLKDEVDYSKNMLSEDDPIDLSCVNKALEVVTKYDIKPYLIHGDFGAHNFIVNDSKMYVIDPMGVIGDPIYDFYFAIFSEPVFYLNIKIEDILTYFDKDIEYKKAIMTIMFFIRLCRTYKYVIEDYETYCNYYNDVITKLL